MTKEKINQIILTYKDKIPSDAAILFRQKLENAPEEAYEQIVAAPLKNPTAILLFSIFLGGLGVDRFVLGDTGLGVCKLLFGWLTLGIWPFVDIFCSYKKAKRKNLDTLLMCL